MSEHKTIDDYIFEIEDYVGGNIEGIEQIDRMSFTVFLRKTLEDLSKYHTRRCRGCEAYLSNFCERCDKAMQS